MPLHLSLLLYFGRRLCFGAYFSQFLYRSPPNLQRIIYTVVFCTADDSDEVYSDESVERQPSAGKNSRKRDIKSHLPGKSHPAPQRKAEKARARGWYSIVTHARAGEF